MRSNVQQVTIKQTAADLLAVAAGGAIGALLRFGLGSTGMFAPYPAATIGANWLASLLLGALTGWIVYRIVARRIRLLLAVGLLGSFSTMSALAADAFRLADEGGWLRAVVYIGVTFAGGMALAWGGYALGAHASQKGRTDRAGRMGDMEE